MKIKILLITLFSFLFITTGISWSADMIFGVGKKGNTYDIVVGDNIAVQLMGSDIEFQKEHFAGSDKIVTALKNGDIDAGVVQFDSLIGKSFPFQIVARTHDEFIHLLTLYNGKIKKVGDLLGKTIAVGKVGGGTKITWRNFCDLDPKYKDKVATIPKSGSMALSDLESGKIDAILSVGGLRNGDMKRANKKKKTFKLIKVDDSQFNNLEVNDEKVYKFERIDDDVYPNLISGSSVKTLTVPAIVIVSEEWIKNNEDYFDTFYDAVSDALPNIKKALIND